MYSELSLDAHDPNIVSDFWARILALQPHRQDDGTVLLVGLPANTPIWVRPAAPGRMTEYRIHLDLTEPELSTMLQHGGAVVDTESYPWIVLQGPEGSELCVHALSEPAERRHIELVVNSADPGRSARWWARILGCPCETSAAGDYAWVSDIPQSPFEALVFTRIDAPRTRDPRLRLGVAARDISRLTDAGAKLLRVGHDRPARYLMADPDGHEFYVAIRD